jgi:hypothetical protein
MFKPSNRGARAAATASCESPTWSALGRVVAYAETGRSGVAEIAPAWSACAYRSQKLLDNGQLRNCRQETRTGDSGLVGQKSPTVVSSVSMRTALLFACSCASSDSVSFRPLKEADSLLWR